MVYPQGEGRARARGRPPSRAQPTAVPRRDYVRRVAATRSVHRRRYAEQRDERIGNIRVLVTGVPGSSEQVAVAGWHRQGRTWSSSTTSLLARPRSPVGEGGQLDPVGAIAMTSPGLLDDPRPRERIFTDLERAPTALPCVSPTAAQVFGDARSLRLPCSPSHSSGQVAPLGTFFRRGAFRLLVELRCCTEYFTVRLRGAEPVGTNFSFG